MAPGSPAANGEIQLESEVNNPVWEKTREFWKGIEECNALEKDVDRGQ